MSSGPVHIEAAKQPLSSAARSVPAGPPSSAEPAHPLTHQLKTSAAMKILLEYYDFKF